VPSRVCPKTSTPTTRPAPPRCSNAPLRAPVNSSPASCGKNARTGRIDQVSGTVRSTDSIRLLIAQGVTHWVEVGAGGVPSGLLKNIDPNPKAARFGEAAELETVQAHYR